mgnify:CR=1 FL=1
MQKMKKTFIALVVCVGILAGSNVCTIPVCAQESINVIGNARMAYIYSYGTNLSISNSGVASVSASVVADSDVSSVFLRVQLQKFVLGNWITENTWEGTYADNSASISATYQVSSGTYRTVMRCTANSETKTATSSTVYY